MMLLFFKGFFMYSVNTKLDVTKYKQHAPVKIEVIWESHFLFLSFILKLTNSKKSQSVFGNFFALSTLYYSQRSCWSSMEICYLHH